MWVTISISIAVSCTRFIGASWFLFYFIEVSRTDGIIHVSHYKRYFAYLAASSISHRLLATFSGEDLRAKLQDVDALVTRIGDKARHRGDRLARALEVADKFESDYQEAIRALRDIQDNLNSQDSPGVDVATIEEQQRELQVRIDLCRAAHSLGPILHMYM